MYSLQGIALCNLHCTGEKEDCKALCNLHWREGGGVPSVECAVAKKSLWTLQPPQLNIIVTIKSR